MTPLSLPTPRPFAGLSSIGGRWFAQAPVTASLAVLTLAAFVLRSAWFGDPLAGYDEQLYLLIGARMWEGAVPYVDLWDRKPVGLFVLYAAFARFGDGIVAYQVAAAVSAALTGFVIRTIVRRHYPESTALLCGVFYLLWIGTMGGEAGQAPVFYNLLVAVAALLTLDALPRIGQRRGLAAATLAMLLCGIAITIKTTAIFEGIAFGCALVVAAIVQRLPPARLASTTAALMIAGAAPFALAGAIYATMGHFAAFWFANAQSALLRTGDPNGQTLPQLTMTLMGLAPAAFLAAASLNRGLAACWPPRGELWLLAAWVVAGIISFASVGYFLHHYALPLLTPLAIASARFLQASRRRRLAVIILAIFPLAHQLIAARILLRSDRAAVAHMVEAIPADVTTGCLFVFGGPTILYHMTKACLVTPYVFSDHLYRGDEAQAIGTSAADATDAALAKRPRAIVMDDRVFPADANTRSVAAVRAALAQDYVLRTSVPYQYFADVDHRLQIWVRRDAVLPVRIG